MPSSPGREAVRPAAGLMLWVGGGLLLLAALAVWLLSRTLAPGMLWRLALGAALFWLLALGWVFWVTSRLWRGMRDCLEDQGRSREENRRLAADKHRCEQLLSSEEQLVQAAKMATLGEMSAGVAHELNQPLSVLATAASILTKQAQRPGGPEPQVLVQVARELNEQVQRATRIIEHLREFGRKGEVTRRPVDLERPLQGVFQLLGRQLRLHDIEVEQELPPDLPPVWGDANRLEQVFVNLVLNARDAIEQRRRHEPGLRGRIRVAARRQGDQVVVVVSDNGAGIPPQVRQRIFEPFFTTKEVGKGTGLGLSISYGIVRDYGGAIRFTSRTGEGTTFEVCLPVAEPGEGAA